MKRKLTPTSYAMLGFLSIKPWSAYELTQQFRRSIWYVLPRTEANRYAEPKRLVAAGLATSKSVVVGGRKRQIYSITKAGREELEAWLGQPAPPTLLESEAMLKVLFGNYLPTTTLLQLLKDFQMEAEATELPWRSVAREYVENRGPFPERLHVSILYWVLLDRWAQLRADWAKWAAAEVATWPDENGPRNRESVRALLERALASPGEFPS